MKNIFVILLSLSLFSCTAKKRRNDLAVNNLKGKVKKVIENSWPASGDSANPVKNEPLTNTDYDYDEKGFTPSTERLPMGVYATKKLDDKGYVAEEDFMIDGKPSSKFTFTHNEQGQITESDTYLANGTLDGKAIWKRNAKGDPIEWDLYVDDGGKLVLDQLHTYSYDGYDENGNWLKQITYSKGKPIVITEREIRYYE